jgi:hypothetical protein
VTSTSGFESESHAYLQSPQTSFSSAKGDDDDMWDFSSVHMSAADVLQGLAKAQQDEEDARRAASDKAAGSHQAGATHQTLPAHQGALTIADRFSTDEDAFEEIVKPAVFEVLQEADIGDAEEELLFEFLHAFENLTQHAGLLRTVLTKLSSHSSGSPDARISESSQEEQETFAGGTTEI